MYMNEIKEKLKKVDGVSVQIVERAIQKFTGLIHRVFSWEKEFFNTARI